MTKIAEKTAPKSEKMGAEHPAAKAAGSVFDKLRQKANFDNKKIDKWQKDWLSLPENRKKYEHLKDAPQVMGEELVAISNDIIDFVQGQESGKSALFNKLSGFRKEVAKDPVGFLKGAGKKGTQMIMGIATKAADKAAEALAKPAKKK